MKDIFTYPNNAATSYIDPLYVGDASDGFQKRIQDLKDGNYKSWDGTAPTDSVSNIMQNISKFADNYYNNIGDTNITINDMYTYPLLKGTVTLDNGNITANVTSISHTSNQPSVLTSANHGLSDLNPVLLSNFDGTAAGVLNNLTMYVTNKTANTFNLAWNSDGSSPLGNYTQFTSAISEFTTANNNLSLKLANSIPLASGTEMLIPTIGQREIFLSQTSASYSNGKSFFRDDGGRIGIGYNHVGNDTHIVLVDMYYDPIGEDHLDLYTATIVIPNETIGITARDISEDGNTIRLTGGSPSASGHDIFIQNSTPLSDGWAIIRRTTIQNPTAGRSLGPAQMSGDGTKVLFVSGAYASYNEISQYVISTDTITVKSNISTYDFDYSYLYVNTDGSVIMYTGSDGVDDKLVLYNFASNSQVAIIANTDTNFSDDMWDYIIGSNQNSGIVNYYQLTNSAITLIAIVNTGVTTNLSYAPQCSAASITNQFAVFAGYDKILYEYNASTGVTEIDRLNKNYVSGPKIINDVDRGLYYEVSGVTPIVGRTRRGGDAMLNYIKRNNISVYMKAHATLSNYYDLYTDVAVTTKFDWTTIPNGYFTALPGSPVRLLTSTVNPQQTFVFDSTVGTAFYDGPDTFALTSINLVIPSQSQYQYLDVSGVLQPGALIEAYYILTDDTPIYTSEFFPSNILPNITLTTDANGRLSSATLNATLPNFLAAKEILMRIGPLPDQYVPPAANTAADEDIFDTQDQWTNAQGINSSKEFGKNIIPTTASITYVQPSTTNMSQNGRKYVRSSGFVKTKLEVNYTNLTKAEFQELHADAQAARGQAATFYLVVGLWGGKVLNFYANASRSNPRLVTPYAAGETLLKLGGFNSNEQDVFKKGEMIIGNNGNENGDLLTVLNTVDANVYGEAKIRVAYGNPSSAINGTKVFKNPYWIVVSLDSDEFQYTVDTFGLYNVTVGFETGSYT